jgi:hypothetical protein
MDKYSKDFEITGGDFMKIFLGMDVEQRGKTIKLHLDCYILQSLPITRSTSSMVASAGETNLDSISPEIGCFQYNRVLKIIN